MPELPLVSIVTCSYNNSNFILDTLESIRNQTYPNIELVIVDDCSTDDSVSIINNWLKTYRGKVKFIRHNINRGGSIPYNVGLKAATGKYYAAVDTDDTILLEKIEKQVNILEATGTKIAAVYSDAYVMDVKGDPIDGLFIQRHRQFSNVPSGNIFEELLHGNYIPIMSLLVKREVFKDLGEYDESLVYGDFDMWLRMAKKYELVYSDYISGKYRIRPGSLSFTIKNWDYSNAKIFLKHADSQLPVESLTKTGWHAYSSNDHKTMPLIRELAEKTSDRILITIYLLWKFRISIANGEAILDYLRQHIETGLSPNIVNANDSDTNIFLNEIVHSLPLELLKKIAYEAYSDNKEETLSLIDKLANKTNNRYLKTAYLLWRFKVSRAKGQLILLSIKDNVDDVRSLGKIGRVDPDMSIFLNDIVPVIPFDVLQKIALEAYVDENEDTIIFLNELADRNNDKYLKAACLLWKFRISPVVGKLMLAALEKAIDAGLPSTIKNESTSDIEVFLVEIVPAIPLDLLKRMAYDAYANDNVDTMHVVNEVASSAKDRYLVTAALLWKLKILPDIGKKILSVVDDAINRGLDGKIHTTDHADASMFLTEVIPMLPGDLLKRLTSEAYYENNLRLQPLIKELVQKTKSRYFKAVILLWKFKVNAFTGKIILSRIDGYCSTKLNNYYIDMCIYKDIIGAFRTNNSTLFRSK